MLNFLKNKILNSIPKMLIILMLFSTKSFANHITVGSGSGTVSVTSMSGLNSGDSIYINTGSYTSGVFGGLNNVTIINHGGVVTFTGTVDFGNFSSSMTNVVFTGTGYNGTTYGFVFNGSNTANFNGNGDAFVSTAPYNTGIRFNYISFQSVPGNCFDFSNYYNNYNGSTTSFKLYKATFSYCSINNSGEFFQGAYGGASTLEAFCDSVDFDNNIITQTNTNGEEVAGTITHFNVHDNTITYIGTNPNLDDVGAFTIAGCGQVHHNYMKGGRAYLARVFGFNYVGQSSYDFWGYNNIALATNEYGMFDLRTDSSWYGPTSYTTSCNFHVVNNTIGNKTTVEGYETPVALVYVLSNGATAEITNNVGFNLIPAPGINQSLITSYVPSGWTQIDTSNNRYYAANAILTDLADTSSYCQLSSGSSLIGAGLYHSNITNDYQYRTRSNPPSIGAEEYVTGTSAPALTAAGGATVDNSFTITFTDNPTWRAAVTAVQVNGQNLSYTLNSGSLIISPSSNTILQTAGTYNITVIATGYSNDDVSQLIVAGSPTKLSIFTQPAANINGLLSTQPVIRIVDQYGNLTSSTLSVVAAVGSGSYTLGGTTTVSASSGVATFTNLTATSSAGVTGATITFTASGITGTTSSTFNIPSVAPTLVSASGATVDNSFTITFVDNPTWRAAVTAVKVNGQNLTYTLGTSSPGGPTGTLSISPANNTVLQVSNIYTITVIATGYSNDVVTQTIGVGAANKLVVSTQPAAPASNGSVLSTQPVVHITDQYGNLTSSTLSVVAAVGSGSYTLGGTTTIVASGGVATFTNLTATSLAAVTGATITFTAAGITGATSNTFTVAVPPPPTLTPASGVTVDNSFTITFTDNSSWRAAVTSVQVNSQNISYTLNAGALIIAPSSNTILQTPNTYTITVIATGYSNDIVTQTISVGSANKLVISTQPVASPTNGAALTTQPVVHITDQYGNLTSSTLSVVAAVGSGSYTLGGTTTIVASGGVATFTNLTTTSASAVTGATITFSASGISGVTSNTFNISSPSTPPTLTPASGATVDNTFNITFTDNPSWRAVVTAIQVNGQNISYSLSSGSLSISSANNVVLQTPNTYTITVIATGYPNDVVSQPIGVGAANKLVISTQPVASPTNGSVLTTQPVIRIVDQYGNLTSSTLSVVAAVGSGSYTLGGTTTVSASSGVATFTNLTTTSASAVTGATITFSASGISGVTSNTFNISATLVYPVGATGNFSTIDPRSFTEYLSNGSNVTVKTTKRISKINVVANTNSSNRLAVVIIVTFTDKTTATYQ